MLIASVKGKEMIQHITPIYADSEIEQGIYEAIGSEWDGAEELSGNILKQLFPQTATWGLGIWEQRLRLPTNLTELIEKRRGKVIAKLQSKYIVNPERIALIIKNYAGADVLVVENITPYTFKIVVNIDDIVDNKDLTTIVKKVKPSHLSFMPEFVLKIINTENFEVKNINRFFINFRGNIPLLLDGAWLLNGENLLNGYESYSDPISIGIKNSFFISENETFTSKLKVEKDLWHLDGTYNLDGTKILDAEIMEEAI